MMPRLIWIRAFSSIVVAAVLAAAPTRAAAQTAADFFSDAALQEVRIIVSDRDWSTLKAHFEDNTYYTADFTWRGITVRNVGIRSRGGGTRSGIKPGLKVDVNHYLSDQEFLGLKGFELKNMETDPSLLRETLAMKLYAQAGMTVPREAHARLYVNGQYAGVYVIVESIDRPYLSRVFGPAESLADTGGYLFEYKWKFDYGFEDLGPDLKPYAAIFEPQTRQTDAVASLFNPIEEMIHGLNTASDADFTATLEKYLGSDLFVKYLAVELFTVEWDGLAGNWGANNFYLYRFRQSDHSQLIPKDRDHAFSWDGVNASDFIAAPITLRLDTNVITRRAMALPELRQRFLDSLAALAGFTAATTADDSRDWLEREIDRQAGQIASAVSEDPVFPFSAADFNAEVEFLRAFARDRPGIVLEQIAQMEQGPRARVDERRR